MRLQRIEGRAHLQVENSGMGFGFVMMKKYIVYYPQKSKLRLTHGPLKRIVMFRGSIWRWLELAWHGMQFLTAASVALSMPGNQTLLLISAFVLLIPWWPSCASWITLLCNVIGITKQWFRSWEPFSLIVSSSLTLRNAAILSSLCSRTLSLFISTFTSSRVIAPWLDVPAM